jgi:hypothetical protein
VTSPRPSKRQELGPQLSSVLVLPTAATPSGPVERVKARLGDRRKGQKGPLSGGQALSLPQESSAGQLAVPHTGMNTPCQTRCQAWPGSLLRASCRADRSSSLQSPLPPPWLRHRVPPPGWTTSNYLHSRGALELKVFLFQPCLGLLPASNPHISLPVTLWLDNWQGNLPRLNELVLHRVAAPPRSTASPFRSVGYPLLNLPAAWHP